MNILHFETEKSGLQAVAAHIAKVGLECQLFPVRTHEDYAAALARGDIDLLILEYRLPGLTGLEAVAMALRTKPELPCIFYSESLRAQELGDYLKTSALDFVRKPDLDGLMLAVRRGLVLARARVSQKQAESALQKCEAYHQALLAHGPDLLLVARANGTLTFQSPSLERVTGYRPEDVLGHSVFQFLHPEDGALVHKALAASLQDAGQPQELRLRFRHRDGSWRLFESVCQSLTQDGGEPIWVLHAQDVTGRVHMEQSLRDVEVKYRALVDQSVVGVFLLGSGPLLFINEAGARLLGAAPHQLMGQLGLVDLVLEIDQPKVQEVIQRLRTTAAAPFDFEFRSRRPEGVHLCCRCVGQVIEFQGQPALLGLLLDATREKRATWEFSKMSRILELAEESVMLTDPDGLIQYVNPAFEQSTGYREAEVLGRTPRLLKSGKHPAEFYQELWNVIKGGGLFRNVFINRRKDGQLYYQQGTLFAIRDDQGAIASLVSVARDLTPERQGELQSRECVDLLDEAPDALVTCGLDNRVRLWNRGAEGLYGVPRTEAQGRLLWEVIPTETPEKVAAIRAVVLAQGEGIRELTRLKPNGDIVAVASRWSVARDEAGEPKTFFIVHTDITPHKKLMAQYLQAQRLESLGTLAGGIAHELNNLLAPVLMSLQLLRQEASAERRGEILVTLEENVLRGVEIVRQIQGFASKNQGARVSVPVKYLLKELVTLLRETFPKSVVVKLQVPGDLWTVYADPAEIQQIVLNLCTNARDAMPDGGTLTLTAENLTFDDNYAAMKPGTKPGRVVAIHVADTGTGISDQVRPKIFQPFFTTKGERQGTGLGLSTVMGIVSGYGGWLNVESKLGHGTTIRLHLPAEPPAPSPTDPPLAQGILHGGGRLILVVDDEAAICALTKKTLEYFGYRTLVAEDGTEAVARYTQNLAEVSAVITDLSMPKMDGITLIRVIRKLNPAARIIVMSGRQSDVEPVVTGELGVKDVLLKPFTSQTLLLTLQNLLGKS